MFLKTFLKKALSQQNINILCSRFKHVNLSYSIIDVNSKSTPPTISPSKASMIVLHGLYGNKKNFESLARQFSRQTGIQVITVDVRNHGSSGHGEEMDYLTLSEDVHQLMTTELSIREAIILGHSMGGKIAMALALNRPDQVRALLVVDIVPNDDSGNMQNNFYETLMRRMMEMNFSGMSLNDARKYAADGLASVVEDNQIIDFLITNLVVSSDKTVKWRLNLPALLHNYNDYMAFPPFLDHQYHGPTLFIGGALSKYMKAADEGLIKGYFPAANITMIENAGHWVHADEPVNFAKHVVQFIRSVI